MDLLEELTPEQVQALAELAEEQAKQEAEVLNRVMLSLEQRRDHWITAYAELEQRRISDVRQYEGMSRLTNTKQQPHDQENGGPPVLHATRAKTDMVEARLADMLFPANQPQWKLVSEPVHGIDVSMVQPMDGETPEQAVKREVDASVEALNKEIRDQFAESDFGKIGRRVVRDACQIGTGVVCGPVNAVKIIERYLRGDGAIELDIQEDIAARVKYVDPWMFYPEPVDDLDKACGAFYLELMPKQDVDQLRSYPDARPDQIDALLQMKPDLGAIGLVIAHRNQHTGFTEATEGRYGVWRYTGILTDEEAKAIGIPCECGQVMADLYFSQGLVLLAKVSPLKGSYRIPYYAFAPFPDRGTWTGLSVPFMCRDSQRSAQAAYEIWLYNAAVSAGPIVFHRTSLKPTDGKMAIRGPKFFKVENDEQSLSDLIHVETIPNMGEQAQAIMERNLQLMDEDINLPQFTNPEVNKPTNTSSGLAMWLNAITIVQRRAAAAFDDMMTPLLRAFVRWNRLYSDNPKVQVNVQVMSLGQSELLVKDLQIQNALAYAQLSGPGGILAGEVDTSALARHISQRFEVPDDVLLTPAQKQEMKQNQPPDPAQIQAELQQREMALKEAKLQAEVADKERDDFYRAQDRQLDYETRMRELAIKEREQQLEALKMQNEREMRLIELAQSKEIKFEELATKLKIADTSKAIAEYTTAFKGQIDAQKVALSREEMALKVSPVNPSNTGI